MVSLRPTAAAMSPAHTSVMSSRWLACICRMRPTRSFLSLFALYTYEPALELAGVHPEVRELAHEGIGHDLESDRRERLVRRLARLTVVSPLCGFTPSTGGTSSGEGR